MSNLNSPTSSNSREKVAGYEPKQVLLLHASNLEADHIGELMDVLRKRGYRFISLEEALGDPRVQSS